MFAAGQETPDKIALAVLSLTGAERWSYGKLTEAVLGTATGLLQQGLGPRDRVLMRLGNTVDFPVTYLAAIAVGLIPVPTSAMLTAPEVTKICAEVAPRLIVAAPGIAVPDGPPCPVMDAATLRDMRALPPARFEMGDPERPAYIIYTSGTSGVPRAVTHAHRAIWARRMMWDGWYGLTREDRLLHAGAFNWTYTLGTGLMDPWAIGATALIPAEGTTPEQLPLLLKRHDATIFAAAPGVYRRMLRAALPALPRLRHGLSAGEKLPAVTRTAWEDATGTLLHEAYGMSECSTFISGSPRRSVRGAILGFPQTGRRVAILDGAEILARDTPGTLAVNAQDPGLMLGYWSAAKNAPEPIEGEWFLTGDTMAMGTDGALSYLGREDDMMNAGGFRVSPLEVEAALSQHPAIQECAAVEQRVADDTSIIALHYVAVAEQDSKALEEFAAAHLARYKCPRAYHRADDLPRNPNGKIQRRALRSG
ncbi:Acetyl-coenzyme A synthetase [Candidatus Rhodobacter oscarellae]|uniref:Acetyl-coenzyme A synthetase n=1 Tax=Candidatus Rhodobacter oscarellae TaxID=1675527 RepID=A0A0J9E5Y8_9RHOB|nr:Acetyl-coenzyme A synthetase [Candidatus Rhodobacter lobularis]